MPDRIDVSFPIASPRIRKGRTPWTPPVDFEPDDFLRAMRLMQLATRIAVHRLELGLAAEFPPFNVMDPWMWRPEVVSDLIDWIQRAWLHDAMESAPYTVPATFTFGTTYAPNLDTPGGVEVVELSADDYLADTVMELTMAATAGYVQAAVQFTSYPTPITSEAGSGTYDANASLYPYTGCRLVAGPEGSFHTYSWVFSGDESPTLDFGWSPYANYNADCFVELVVTKGRHRFVMTLGEYYGTPVNYTTLHKTVAVTYSFDGGAPVPLGDFDYDRLVNYIGGFGYLWLDRAWVGLSIAPPTAGETSVPHVFPAIRRMGVVTDLEDDAEDIDSWLSAAETIVYGHIFG